jgi:hypothetical protein
VGDPAAGGTPRRCGVGSWRIGERLPRCKVFDVRIGYDDGNARNRRVPRDILGERARTVAVNFIRDHE